jgi:hypothetical protein
MQAQDSRYAAWLAALYESHATDVFRYALHLTAGERTPMTSSSSSSCRRSERSRRAPSCCIRGDG